MNDRKHLKFIDSLICVCCGRENPTHHHLLRVQAKYYKPKEGEEDFLIPKYNQRGMGKKNPDMFTIPLCPRCHQMLHSDGNERAFLAYCGINDPEKFATSLYNITGNREKAIDLIKWTRLGNV